MPTVTLTATGVQKIAGLYGNGNGATYVTTVTAGTATVKKFDVRRRPIRGGPGNVVGSAGNTQTVTYTETARFDFELEVWADISAAGTVVVTQTKSGETDQIHMATYGTDATGNITGLVGLGADIAAGADLIIGGATQGAGKEIFQVIRTDTNASAVSRPTTAYIEGTAAPGSAGTFDFHTFDVLGKVSGSNANISANTGLYAIEGKNTPVLTASQTLGTSIGVFGTSVNASTVGSTVTNSIGVQGHVQNTGAGTSTIGAAFFVKSPTVSSGQITNAYGMFMQAITAGSAQNFAIQTNAGQINFFASTATPAGGTALVGMTMGSAKVGLYWGSGAPSLSAAQGSLYMRTDGGVNSRLYSNTDGGTTWTPFTNAA